MATGRTLPRPRGAQGAPQSAFSTRLGSLKHWQARGPSCTTASAPCCPHPSRGPSARSHELRDRWGCRCSRLLSSGTRGFKFQTAAARELSSNASSSACWARRRSSRRLTTWMIAPSAEGGGYLLRMTIRGAERELRDADCRTLFKSAVVVAAASVRPDLLSAEPAANAAASPQSSPPMSNEQPNATAAQSDTVAVSPPPASAASDDSASWRGGIGIGGGAIAGLVPGVAPLVEIRGLAERARFGGLLSLRYVAVGAEELEGERGVEIRSFGGRAAALYQPAAFARLTAGLEADLMLGQGTGVTTLLGRGLSLAAEPRDRRDPAPSRRVELELALSGRWAFLRPRFQIGGRRRLPRPLVRRGWGTSRQRLPF